MRIAITGTTGRVGRALADRLARRDGHEVIELPRARLDLSENGWVGEIGALDFDVLLNPAGLTGLEACEDDPTLARQVNARAPGLLAEACAGRPMLHFSTDYVFAGRESGLKGEDEPVEPLSVYGRSKADGETAALAAGAAVMRVSWVFGPEKDAFPDSVISKALKGETVAAVADKFSLPTFTADLAEWVAAWLDSGFPGGIFHACQSGEPVSWHDMAAFILSELAGRGHDVGEALPLRLEEMTAFRAVRPRHTAMSCDRLAGLLGRAPRHWTEAMREHVASRLICR